MAKGIMLKFTLLNVIQANFTYRSVILLSVFLQSFILNSAILLHFADRHSDK